jgi:hypothetical protein
MAYETEEILPYQQQCCHSRDSGPLPVVFFIYNLNQQSEFTFYKIMLWLLQCLHEESSSGESPVPQIRSIGQFLLSRLFSSPNSSVSQSWRYSMGFAGYVAVCVQLYCRCFTVLHLVVAVLHYMFRPTWPGFAGYVAVCVQLYCRCFTVIHLLVAVLHYMFRPKWPSSGVYGFCRLCCRLRAVL